MPENLDVDQVKQVAQMYFEKSAVNGKMKKDKVLQILNGVNDAETFTNGIMDILKKKQINFELNKPDLTPEGFI